MVPPSHMRSVADRNVDMRRTTVQPNYIMLITYHNFFSVAVYWIKFEYQYNGINFSTMKINTLHCRSVCVDHKNP